MPSQDLRRSVWRTWRATLLLALVLPAGCGGIIQFRDDRPIQVVGTLPPPPEPKPQRVVVKKDRIEINEKIQFDFDKATIKPESHDLLNEIVAVIRKNTQIKKLSIEGHTDSDGSDKYNLVLSERRADAVRDYLVGQSIDKGMLTSKGHGESRPLADNSSDAGKEKNRRVEFLITDQEEVTQEMEVDAKTGGRRLVGQQTPGEAK
jgi:outer membrane protein OmpA-like peptidoglycan-associated protein